jgi:hypothetical protein
LPDGTLLSSVGDGGKPPIALMVQIFASKRESLRHPLWQLVRINDDG